MSFSTFKSSHGLQNWSKLLILRLKSSFSCLLFDDFEFCGFFWGDFDCSCTKLVILWLNVECVEVCSPDYEYWLIRTSDENIVCIGCGGGEG